MFSVSLEKFTFKKVITYLTLHVRKMYVKSKIKIVRWMKNCEKLIRLMMTADFISNENENLQMNYES